jgi:hypothetical protein
MSPRIKWIVGVLAVALFGGIIYLTTLQSQSEYEVCMAFNGRTHCAKAAGRTPDEAIQAARSICCTMLTSGREENMVCLQNEPSSVRKLQ